MKLTQKSSTTILVSLFLLVMLGFSACTAEQKVELSEAQNQVKFKLGVASYSLRKFDRNEAIAFTKKLGVDNIAFKSFHLKLDAPDAEIAEAVASCAEAGLNLYAGGVIYMTNETEVDQAFEYAKKAGMKMIVGVPNHELLSYVENKVKAYDIQLAIHNHGPGDKLYPSAESAYVLIKNMDPRMGLCIDVGHTKRIGRSPSQDVRDFFDRVLDIHIKDVTAADHDGSTCEIGRGVIDHHAFLKDLVALGYDGVVALEYEKDGDDPFAGMAESMGYVKGILSTFKQTK